jgi:LuxR family maltose regulon positive regulatory protein
MSLAARAELCLPLIATGELVRLESEALSVLAEAVERGWRDFGSLVGATGYLGWLALWRGDLDMASGYFDQAEESILETDCGMRLLVHYFRGITRVLRGDLDGAASDADRIRVQGESGCAAPYWESMANSLEAALLLAQGRVAEAVAVATAASSGPTYRLATCLRAEVLLLSGAPEQALATLDELPPAQLFANIATIVGVVRCLALTDLARTQAAHEALESALVAAAPAGLLGPFVVHQERLRPLLSAHVERGTSQPELLARLVELVAQPVVQRAGGWDEQLTPRELSILRYLRTPMSNAEIAAEQFVSVNTVKTHTAKIYRKLGVTSRREAVRRAAELGLYDPVPQA